MKNAVLIGDSVLFLEMVQEHLERKHRKVECIKFYNPFDALHYISEGNPVDCIITDYMMPKINGLEIAYRVLHNHINPRIIIYSGYDKEYLLNRWKEYGLEDNKIEICTKSSLEDLVDMI